jgi:large subunit ribosomal protein L18
MRSDTIKRAAQRRKLHARKHVLGTPNRPRLSIFRSNRHIYAQVIDDVAGATLASASTLSKTLHAQLPKSGDKKAAAVVGEAIAREALGVGIKYVRFDRGGYKFHGRTKALAEAARKAGLVF